MNIFDVQGFPHNLKTLSHNLKTLSNNLKTLSNNLKTFSNNLKIQNLLKNAKQYNLKYN